jgi:protease II
MNRSVALVKQMSISNYDPAMYRDYVKEILARDGTPLPLTVAFRRDVDRGKTNPLLLFAADQ